MVQDKRLPAGTWVRFRYSGTLTTPQIQEFFREALGSELSDDQISTHRQGNFMVSFDRLQVASLIDWFLEGQKNNPHNIGVNPPLEAT